MVRLVEAMDGSFDAHPVLVVSNDPAAGGLAKAAALGVPTSVVDHRGQTRPVFEAGLDAELRRVGADLICLAGFMRILTPAFVARWAGQILNIHPSLLPRYPGLDTHARALAAGDAEAGCTVHEVTGDLDAGPILGQARVLVNSDDTSATLAARVLEIEHQLYPMVLRRFASGDKTPVHLPAMDETPIKTQRPG